MKSNYALAGLTVVVLGGALWLATAFLGTHDPAAMELGLGPAQGQAGEQTNLDFERSSEPQSPVTREETRTAVSPSVESKVASWKADLGGLVGRVVEEDLTPVAGISVALVQVDANLMLAADWVAQGEPPPQLVIGRTLTDEEGRFRLDGAYDASFQGLGIDLRGPRSTIRVVDTQLHHGEVTDVGDIVLPAGCTVFGRVVDEGGQPVRGARVRIISIPQGSERSMLLQAGVQDFRSDCFVGISEMIVEGGGSPVIDLPPMIRAHLDDLPIPTTYTNSKGEYRMQGVPIGELFQGVDMVDRVGVSRLVRTTAGEVELEVAVLTPGRTIQGRVVDSQGNPVQGAEVIAGSEIVFGEAAILHPAGITGPDGRFSVRGCPETGGAMACARRNRDEHWVGVLQPADQELEIKLESVLAITVHVVDSSGEAVRDAKLEMAPSALELDSPMGVLGQFMGLGAERREPRFVETEEGTYVCDQVTPGRYQVTARPSGLAMARQDVEWRKGKTELTLICPRGQGLDLTVIDALTGEAIAGARASVIGPGFPFFSSLAVGRTARDGHVRLGPYSLEEPEEDAPSGMSMDGHQILVQHPRYADASLPLDEGVQEVQVALFAGGEIQGQITWGSNPPQSIYMIVLEIRGRRDDMQEAFQPPRLGRSDLSGSFRFTNLPPGEYRLAVFDRFFDTDPLQLLMAEQAPTMVHREDGVQLEPASVTDVVIDLSPTGRGQTARLAGSIYLDGRAVVGASVWVNGRGAGVSAKTDANGNFETPDFLALGDVLVRVDGEIETSTGVLARVSLHSQSLTPVPQSVHRLDLDLRSLPLRVHVQDRTSGAPVVGAKVELRGSGGSRRLTTKTDEQGQAELTFLGEGQAVVKVSANGYAQTSVQLDTNEPGFSAEIEIELRGAVTCAGLADLTAFDVPELGDGAYLRIAGSDDGKWNQLSAKDLSDDRRARFRVSGLTPGSYKAHLWVNGSMAETISFELPEGGEENLLLAFLPADDGQ